MFGNIPSMGRHTSGAPRRASGRTRRGGLVAAAAAAVIIGVGGAWAASAVIGGDNDPADATESAPSATSATSSDTSSDVGSSSEEADSASTVDPSDGNDAPAALDACVTEVQAAEKVADAVAASAKSWKQHSGAQVKFDAGEYTQKEAKKAWADSKARGPKDVKRYSRAVKAAKSTKQACSEAGDGEAVTDCTDRLKALKTVNKQGALVHRQWTAHLDMMASQEKGATYQKRWERMVTKAGPALDDYEKALTDLNEAPACA